MNDINVASNQASRGTKQGLGVSFVTGGEVARTLTKLTRGSSRLLWSVAWTTRNAILEELLRAGRDGRIEKCVVGICFYQTDPFVLKELKPFSSVRVARNDTAGVFHPKVYVFFENDMVAALVGSANFTHSALHYNSEACVLMEGPSTEPVFADLRKYVESEWKIANAISDV